MLLNLLSNYLKDIEATIAELENAYIEHYEEEILTADRLNLDIRIRFLNGNLLELNEAVVIESGFIKHLGYRYHFQDKRNVLIFRYDNTPHFPNLENFPHHKHLKDEVVATEKPSTHNVILEANLLNLEKIKDQ